MGADEDELTASESSAEEIILKAAEAVGIGKLVKSDSGARMMTCEANEARLSRAAKRSRPQRCYFLELPAGKSLYTHASTPAHTYATQSSATTFTTWHPKTATDSVLRLASNAGKKAIHRLLGASAFGPTSPSPKSVLKCAPSIARFGSEIDLYAHRAMI